MFSFWKKHFVFVTGHDYLIGNLSEYYFYALLKAKRTGKKVLFVRKRLFRPIFKMIKYKQYSDLYRLESEHIYRNKPLEFILGLYYGSIFSIHVFYKMARRALKIDKKLKYNLLGVGDEDIFNIDRSSTFSKEKVDAQGWSELFEEKLDLHLSADDEKLCREYEKKLGIKDGDWYVCLHIRTSAYKNNPADTELRNSTPENYTKAIEYINSLGGKVVRIGDPVDMSINPICIDYANSPYKSQIMDIFLIKNCRFYIGTSSGPLDTAWLLGAPVLAVNFETLMYVAKGVKSYDKMLPKHLYKRDSNKQLSVKEIFSKKLYSLVGSADRYDLAENSPDEILLATKEMLEDLESLQAKDDLDFEYERLMHEALLDKISSEKLDADEAYKLYVRSLGNGRICRFYLEQNLQ